MTEDDLRDRMRDASAGFAPRGDLLESLAEGHARKHKQVRRGVVGGSVAATALVITVLATVFTSAPLPEEVDPATMSHAEIIEKARKADANAKGKIMHYVATWPDQPRGGGRELNPAAYNPIECWVLRSERRGRTSVRDYSELVVAPNQRELVEIPQRKVTIMPGGEGDKDVVSSLSLSSTGDPARILTDPATTVVEVGAEIHLRGSLYEHQVDVWLDPKTFLPKRTKQGVFQFEYSWLPPTQENLRKLTFDVPSDFKRETPKPVSPSELSTAGGAAASSGTETPPAK
nr:hypothetical protein [Kibdelosporangium sp. MJ126-NF4]